MEFNKKILPNGLTVLHEKRDVPVTTVMLGVKYGAAYETEQEKGISHFIEHLCFKGTEKRSVNQISEEVESVGGEVNAFTHEELTAYHVKLPSKHLGVAMDVVFDIFFNASFPEGEVEKEGGVICEEIKMYRDNPRAHVFDALKQTLYKSPFGMFIAGTKDTVKSITRAQLFDKHRAAYTPKNSVLCVVGNNDFEEIVSMAEKLVVDREGPKIERPTIEPHNLKKVENRDGLHQSNLALGFHFPFSGEKGRYVAEVFSAILGEGMSSKLFREVREKRGLVYGVKTELDIGSTYGYLAIWAGTDPEKADEVIKISLEEFSKMGKITKEELEKAKVQVIGNRHVESEGSSETAVNLVLEEISGDAEDYYNFEKKINSITLDEIKNLSKVSEFGSFVLGP
jgi:predicted Zn-dependent peptidase